jgi:hypothetical protein
MTLLTWKFIYRKGVDGIGTIIYKCLVEYRVCSLVNNGLAYTIAASTADHLEESGSEILHPLKVILGIGARMGEQRGRWAKLLSRDFHQSAVDRAVLWVHVSLHVKRQCKIGVEHEGTERFPCFNVLFPVKLVWKWWEVRVFLELQFELGKVQEFRVVVVVEHMGCWAPSSVTTKAREDRMRLSARNQFRKRARVSVSSSSARQGEANHPHCYIQCVGS